jgi:hypothetical protein
MNRYHKVRDLNELRGLPLTTLAPALGTQRRLQALMALGWSLARLEQHTGIDSTYLRVIVRHNQRVQPVTSARIAGAYDALSMTLPPNSTRGERQGVSRTLRYAREHGFVPPLAWDDIDPDATPAYVQSDHDIDWVVVERILSGDPVPATTPERRAVVASWPTTGRPLNDLARLTGWKVERYHPDQEAAA